MAEQTIFEACVGAINAKVVAGTLAHETGQVMFSDIAAAIIQAIIDRTPSPTTVVELTRILREGGVEVPEATFD